MPVSGASRTDIHEDFRGPCGEGVGHGEVRVAAVHGDPVRVVQLRDGGGERLPCSDAHKDVPGEGENDAFEQSRRVTVPVTNAVDEAVKGAEGSVSEDVSS